MNLYALAAFSEGKKRFRISFDALQDYAFQHEEAAEIAGFID